MHCSKDGQCNNRGNWVLIGLWLVDQSFILPIYWNHTSFIIQYLLLPINCAQEKSTAELKRASSSHSYILNHTYNSRLTCIGLIPLNTFLQTVLHLLDKYKLEEISIMNNNGLEAQHVVMQLACLLAVNADYNRWPTNTNSVIAWLLCFFSAQISYDYQ